MFYDLGGAVGWLSTTLLSLYYSAWKEKFYYDVPGPLPGLSFFAPRQLLVTAAVVIWALRLGSFLAHVGGLFLLWCHFIYFKQRAIKAGGDSRFDQIKKDPMKFTILWFAQGMQYCCYSVNSQEIIIRSSHLDYGGRTSGLFLQCTPKASPSSSWRSRLSCTGTICYFFPIRSHFRSPEVYLEER